jgi:3-oxoacyl-[acyl-carrier protein] reductase
MSEKTDSKVALVTGSAMGIGAAIAERLARDGMTVLVFDIQLDQAEKTAQSFRQIGLSAEPIQLDVAQPVSIDAAFEYISNTYGRCDVMVNNAGIVKTFPFIDFPLDNWLATVGVNITGPLLSICIDCREMLPRRNSGGDRSFGESMQSRNRPARGPACLEGAGAHAVG